MRETEKGRRASEKPSGLRPVESVEAGRASWESPWGPGRPGWHRVLGDGREAPALRRRHARWRHRPPLPPPRERARPELRGRIRTTPSSAPGSTRHGQLRRGQDGKSIGNVVDVAEAVERHGGNAIRMWLLQSHCSQPMGLDEILEEKRRSYERLTRLYRQIAGSTNSSELSDSKLAAGLMLEGSTRRCATTSTP